MRGELAHYGIFFMMLITLALSGGCEKPIELKSKWRDTIITIDGMNDEWGSATIYAAKAKVSLTLLNDSKDIYIGLSSRDREVHAHVLGMGLTIWFDPDGGKNKTFGIRFPLGMKDMPMMTKAGEGDPGERLQKMLEESTDELEILGSGEEEIYRTSLTEAKTHGIDVKMGFSRGNLIYELRVPLIQDKDHLYAVGINIPQTDAGTVIGIGFETPELNIEEVRKKKEEGGMGMPSEGQPPGGGRMPGGMPGGAGKPDRLNLWTKVKLASGPSFQE